MSDGAPTVTMTDERGKAYAVPAEQVAAAQEQGFKLEDATGTANRIADEALNEHYSDVGGKIAAGAAGFARGATLGASDVLGDALGMGRDLKGWRDANQGISIGSEIIGTIAPSLVPGGQFTAAGALSRIGGKVVAGTVEKGIARKVLGSVAAGAIEGGGQGAGSYVSQVALDDKPLSAEGFLAATGSGALFGGAAGGVTSLAESALVRAKSLFPRSEVTREAAQDAERAASAEIQSTLSDGRTLAEAARDTLRQNRALVSANDAETAVKLNQLKLQTAEQRLQRETLKTERAAMKAKAPKAPRKGRKAFEEPAPEPIAPTASQDAAVPAAGDDDLLAKLQGTKAALDEGQPFTRIGRSVEDQADDIIGATNPQHAKLADATRELEDAQSALDSWLAKYNTGGKYGKGEVAAFERSQASRDFAGTMRSKEPGYYSAVPESEGTALLPRGRESKFRGSAEQKAEADALFMARQGNNETSAAAILDAGEAAKELAGRFARSKDVSAIAGAVDKGATTVDDSISAALRTRIGEHADIGEDIGEAVEVIGRVEKAHADVVDALGPAAPPSAQQRAAVYRDTVAQHQEASAMRTAQQADDIAKKLPADVAIPSPLTPVEASNVGAAAGSKVRGGMKLAADAGAMLEVLQSLGVPGMPNVRDIPVIGPVLSLYLKARAASAVFRKLGGKLPQSVETVVAARKAATVNRVHAAVDKLLDVGAKGARTAQKLAGPAGGIGYKLFDAKVANSDKPSKKNDTRRDYEARIAELGAAMQPNAIADAVRKQVPTGDPALQQAIIDAQTRKLSFLDAKAPKRLALPTLLKGDGDWMPNRVQLESFGRYIEAAENPVGVLERLGASGVITYEAAETLRTVYPALYKQAQLRLLDRAPELQETLPYARRVSLSILFQVPVDGTMDANFVSYLQQAAKPAANAQPPAQGSPAAAQPTPTAAGPVMLGDRTMTRLDRRAGA